ncbi:hypothetical protein FZEAL_8110 [Fusarium zealandicum]|uniref:Geranylgeranyl pyrophosphate synthetase n=1 Tax=Fusarium zealandicum TaxID=1053134 RepID=A0A8H4XI62_9HYPO|nr:hypothetical protein FZEAL_8110 [Fusarium zealandicum]
MWSSRRPPYGQNHQSSTVTPSAAPPLGDLIGSISRDDLEAGLDVSDRAEITGARLIASYNLVSGPSPEIMIPGQPPRWTPHLGPRKLGWDTGCYYRDVNAASYPKHPLEPAIVSVMKMNPNSRIPVDVVACASTIGNLLRFTKGVVQDRPFRMLAELVGDKLHLIRRENSPKELIPDVKGYGHTFPESYTTWDAAVRRSKSHQRIISYNLCGLDMMVRFEGDGYIRASNPQRRKGSPGKNTTLENALAQIQNLGISTPLPGSEASELKVSKGGESVPQDTVFDLKTRSVVARQRDTLGDQLPRLWIAQVKTFVLAYHERGLFKEENIEIKNVEKDIEEWEEMNQPALTRLGVLLQLIIDRARESKDGKLELVWSNSGALQIRQQLKDAGDVLSAAVRKEWEAWLGEGPVKPLAAEKRDSKMEPTEALRWDDFVDALSDSDEEGKDFAACDQECGYCGKCMLLKLRSGLLRRG